VFDFKADLRSEFTWNTKQLFVYATVDFASPLNPLNQMVFWNTIIQRRDNALMSLPKLRTIFPFAITDQEGSLRGKEFNVTVAWQVMPRVGALYTGSRTFSGFKMPEEYFNREKGKMRPVGAAAAA
jgi:signal peptidase complex subunit 3